MLGGRGEGTDGADGRETDGGDERTLGRAAGAAETEGARVGALGWCDQDGALEGARWCSTSGGERGLSVMRGAVAWGRGCGSLRSGGTRVGADAWGAAPSCAGATLGSCAGAAEPRRAGPGRLG